MKSDFRGNISRPDFNSSPLLFLFLLCQAKGTSHQYSAVNHTSASTLNVTLKCQLIKIPIPNPHTNEHWLIFKRTLKVLIGRFSHAANTEGSISSASLASSCSNPSGSTIIDPDIHWRVPLFGDSGDLTLQNNRKQNPWWCQENVSTPQDQD